MFKNKETGYSAFNIPNIILSTISGLLLLSLYGNIVGGNRMDSAYLLVVIVVSVVSIIIMFVRNLKLGNIVKTILATIICGILGAIVGIIFLIAFFTGNSSKISGNLGSKTYSDKENQYAKANGYYDAETANRMGFDTSDANKPGFDYTQKKF